jgi:hypothetical protein
MEIKIMKKFYFTFGSNHIDVLGNSLGNFYVIVQAENYADARTKMIMVRGAKWSFVYSEDEFGDQAERFDLSERSLEDVALF